MMDKIPVIKTLAVQATENNLERLCAFAKEVFGSHPGLRLSPEGLYHIELAVSEAVTNVIKYAYMDMPVGNVVLEIEIDGGVVTVRVRDKGACFDFEKTGLTLPDDEFAEGTRGIYLIRKVAESVRYGSEGPYNVLTMRFSSKEKV